MRIIAFLQDRTSARSVGAPPCSGAARYAGRMCIMDRSSYLRMPKPLEAADASQPSRAASRCWRFTGDDGRVALQSWALGATDGVRTLARDRRQRRGWSSSVVPTAHSVDCSRSAIAIRDGQWPQAGHCISDLPECGCSASHVRVVPSPPHRLVLTKRDSSGLESTVSRTTSTLPCWDGNHPYRPFRPSPTRTTPGRPGRPWPPRPP